MKRALHTLFNLFVVGIVLAMAAAPVSGTDEVRVQLEEQLSVAALTTVIADCDELSVDELKPAAQTEQVICGEGLMPSHVQLDPGLYAMSAEECETLLTAIYLRAACDPLDADCGAVVPGSVPPPSPKLLGSVFAVTPVEGPSPDGASNTGRLVIDDDRVPASLVLEPPLRPPLTLV